MIFPKTYRLSTVSRSSSRSGGSSGSWGTSKSTGSSRSGVTTVSLGRSRKHGSERRTCVCVCVCVCWWVAETYGKAKLQRRYLDSSSTGASRGSIVTTVALKMEEHWLSQSPLRRTKRSNFCRWWLAEYSPHGQPLPEVQSYQADQCFREDHGVQENQQVQVYQTRPVIGHRVDLSFLPWDSSLSRVLTGASIHTKPPGPPGEPRSPLAPGRPTNP